MTNTRRLQKALDRVFNETHAWGQGHWGAVDYRKIRGFVEDARYAKAPTCGTSFCLAGHATIAAGHTPLLGRGSSIIEVVALKGKLRATIAGEESPVQVADAAIKWLGMDQVSAELMFEAINTLADLYAYAMIFTAGEIVIPDHHPEFEDADGNFYHEVGNFPDEVKARLDEIEQEQYPYIAFETLRGNGAAVAASIRRQIERADQAETARSGAHAMHGA